MPASLTGSALFAVLVAAACALGGTAKAACLGEASDWDPNGGSRGSSIACLNCHDGTVATSVAHGQFAVSDDGGSHPIQISYSLASLRRKGALRPTASVDARLRMPEGNVECITCHDIRSKDGAHLAMPNGESSMCTQCHGM